MHLAQQEQQVKQTLDRAKTDALIYQSQNEELQQQEKASREITHKLQSELSQAKGECFTLRNQVERKNSSDTEAFEQVIVSQKKHLVNAQHSLEQKVMDVEQLNEKLKASRNQRQMLNLEIERLESEKIQDSVEKRALEVNKVEMAKSLHQSQQEKKRCLQNQLLAQQDIQKYQQRIKSLEAENANEKQQQPSELPFPPK